MPRYAGAILLDAKANAFDEALLPNAPLKAVQDGVPRVTDLYRAPDPLRVEGRMTRLFYAVPEGRSPLEVVRGYQQAVMERGGSTLFECAREECGGSPTSSISSPSGRTGIANDLFLLEEARTRDGRTDPIGCLVTLSRQAQRYALLDLPNSGGKAAVLAWTLPEGSLYQADCHPGWTGRTVALVVVVETAAREQRMETVQAAAVGQGLARDGRVALYSILFDTGRAEIKPESGPQIAELVSFLRGDASVRALVVGHTDNQGAPDYNLDLSRRRAQAVVAALTAGGIPATRLAAQGVGMAAPLAANTTDEGRARNRRVELVQQ